MNTARQEKVLRPARDELPPIQLPPPTVHSHITPPAISLYQFQPVHSTTTALEPLKSSVRPSTKKNKRRISNSAVEKRRRERMNDKIERLKTLIPSCKSQFPTSVQQPIHKLSVLQAAVDYIQELHGQLEANLPQDDPVLKNLSVVIMNKNKLK